MGVEFLQLMADIFLDVLEILVRRSCSVVCIKPQSVWLMTMISLVPRR